MNGLTPQSLAGESGGEGWFFKAIPLTQSLFSKRMGFLFSGPVSNDLPRTRIYGRKIF
jgi:hypothetical protein